MPRIIKSIYTCPKCEHPIGWRRRLNASVFSQWPCKYCGTPLGFGAKRCLILLLAVIISTQLWVKPYVDFWVLIVISTLGMYMAFMIDSVVEKHEPQRPDAE